jgi:outer membrane protein assembly factor BamB
MKTKSVKTTVTIITLIMLLSITTLSEFINTSSAQNGTPTPSEWIDRINYLPAYRESPGQSEYPAKSSPGMDCAKTGLSEGPGPETNHVLWRTNVAMTDWQVLLAHNGKIFASSPTDNCIYALDERTGEVLWTRPDSSLARWAQLDNHYIYTTEGGYPVAISQNTGFTRWVGEDRGSVVGSAPIYEVFYDAAAIYTYDGGRRAGNMSCYSVQRGGRVRHVWTNDTIQGGRVGYVDGKLYACIEYNTWMTCVNASTGHLIWNFTGTGVAKDMLYPAPTLAYGNVYLSIYGISEDPDDPYMDHVICLDGDTGAYKWTYATGEYFIQSLSAAYGNVYINGGDRNALICIDGETGDKKWEYNAPGFIDYYDAAIADGKLYVVSAATSDMTGYPPAGSFPSQVNCIDAYTGDLIWSYYLETSGSMPAIIANGKYVVHSHADYLYCFGIGPTTTTIDLTSQAICSGQSTTICGSVEDMSSFSQQYPELQNQWVDGAPVVLSYVKDGTWTDFATVNTDSAGTFIYDWTPPSEGTYKVVARFEGNDRYYYSSAQETVQVATPATETDLTPLENSISKLEDDLSNQTMYILVTLVLVIIAIVIAIYSLLKSRK